MSLATSGRVWLFAFIVLAPPDFCLFLLGICPSMARAFVGMCYPGIVDTGAGQRKPTETLMKRVPLVVLLAIPFSEPNLATSSNGVHELDDLINTHYAERGGVGAEHGMRYTILQRRSHAS